MSEIKDRIIGWYYANNRKIPVIESDNTWVKEQEDLFFCLNCEKTHSSKHVETGEHDEHGIPYTEEVHERAVIWDGDNLRCRLCGYTWSPHSSRESLK